MEGRGHVIGRPQRAECPVLVASAAVLESDEELSNVNGRHVADGRSEMLQPPAIGAHGGRRAAGDLLSEQKCIDGLMQRVSVGFFARFEWRRSCETPW